MRNILMGFLYLFSNYVFCETAVLNLIETFGDYFVHKEFDVDIKPKITSIAPLKTEVKEQIGRSLHADLVIVGYGTKGEVSEFIGASKNLKNDVPLEKIFPNLNRSSDKKWFIFFVSKELSHYVTDKKYIHEYSPFAFLAAVGMQDLTWF